MSKDKKPLPKPPQTPFGRQKHFEQTDEDVLLSDKMAMAQAQGKLDEFVEEKFAGNENAQKLASMMMGMSGMASMGSMTGMPTGKNNIATKDVQPEEATASEASGDESNKGQVEGIEPPDEIKQAIQSGDVKGLVGMLKKMSGLGSSDTNDTGAAPQKPGQQQNDESSGPTPGSMPGSLSENTPENTIETEPTPAGDMPFMEKELLMKLVKIATDNDMSVDKLISRAIKLYIRDYEQTGRM